MNILKLSIIITFFSLSSNSLYSDDKKNDNSYIEHALKIKCENFATVKYENKEKLICLEILKEAYKKDISLAKKILKESIESKININ